MRKSTKRPDVVELMPELVLRPTSHGELLSVGVLRGVGGDKGRHHEVPGWLVGVVRQCVRALRAERGGLLPQR